ncbi:MAG: DNA adenine methylase [Anaerolineaceae bacterium]|nr:DNA adenine methylase [Anaerolineaceae bacterium]
MTSLDAVLAHTARPYLGRARARPFVKWAGGKRALIPDIARLLPEHIGIYWEPFVGGGAVFFALDSRISTARLSDINAELVLTYQVIRKRPEELIERLACHAQQHPHKDYYYQVRKMTHSPDPVDVAARFIYLNKTCYNGLYRVNKKGQFNVPRGRYKNPLICDADGLRKASEVLGKATMHFVDFGRIEPGHQDFVYCDPPYDGTFSGYASDGFGDDDQRRLRDVALKWHQAGAQVMISNADTGLIRGLYGAPPFHCHEVTAPRQINCKGNERDKAAELLITTYAT